MVLIVLNLMNAGIDRVVDVVAVVMGLLMLFVSHWEIVPMQHCHY